MKTAIFIITVIAWIFLSVITGNFANHIIHSMGANHITPHDVIACYALPFIILGVLMLFMYIMLIEKFKL